MAEYILPHDAPETHRLNTQHHAFFSSAGYLLHPRIASSLSPHPSAHIADIGTGTGAWLLALSHAPSTPPTWSLHGLDLSADKFPPPPDADPSACSRLTWGLLDIRKPVPEDRKGTFDVVHLRMLIGGLATGDWVPVARNVYDLLKPGGWIQWHEMDASRIRTYPYGPSTSPGPSPSHGVGPGVDRGVGDGSRGSESSPSYLQDKLVAGLQRNHKFMPDDMPLFSARVREAGFEEVEVHVPASDRVPEQRAPLTWCIRTGMLSALRYLVQADPGCGTTAEEVERMGTKEWLEEEAERTYLQFDMYVVTGRKPLS